MKKLISKIKEGINNKSYRKKYRYYYILTFIIPIMVIMLVNVIVQNVVKDQVYASGNKILKQFFNLLDEEIDVMIEDAYSLVNSNELKTYVKLNVKDSSMYAYKRIGVKRILDSYLKSYQNVLVWCAYDDRVIGNGGAVKGAKIYANIFYDSEEAFQEEFEEIVTTESDAPRFRMLGEKADQQYLCLSLKQYWSNRPEESYVATLIVDKSFASKYIEEGILSEGENVMLFDEDGAQLFSYRESMLDTLPKEMRSNGLYEVKGEKGIYTILVQKSNVMKGFYVMEISQDAFWKPVSGIKRVSFIGIGLSLVVGFCVAIKMNRNTYKPLELVVKTYQDKVKKEFDSSKHNEFEFMEEVLRKSDEERNWMHQRLQNEEKISKRKELLLAVLEGREISDSELRKLAQEPLSDCIYGGILLLKNCGRIGWDFSSFVVNNVMSELLGEQCGCEIISVSGMQHVIILRLKVQGQETVLEKLILQGINWLEQQLGAVAVFGTGNISKEGIYGLRDLYREAQKALEYRFLMKGEAIIRYCAIQERRVEKEFYDDNPLFYMVNEFLKRDGLSENELRVFVKQLTEQNNVNKMASIDAVENFKRKILDMLNRMLAINDVEYFKRNTYTMQLEKAEFLEDYLDCLAGILYEIGNSFRDNKTRKILANKVKIYVEENYSNPDLNVDYLGKEMEMQAAYLSRLFREEYGVLLTNYISQVRIECAKKLLRNSQMTMPEIAEKTGFLSANVFNNNFKKITGLTPGKYRLSAQYTDLDC